MLFKTPSKAVAMEIRSPAIIYPELPFTQNAEDKVSLGAFSPAEGRYRESQLLTSAPASHRVEQRHISNVNHHHHHYHHHHHHHHFSCLQDGGRAQWYSLIYRLTQGKSHSKGHLRLQNMEFWICL